MDKKCIKKEWENQRDLISKLTFSKKDDVHHLLSKFSNKFLKNFVRNGELINCVSMRSYFLTSFERTLR